MTSFIQENFCHAKSAKFCRLFYRATFGENFKVGDYCLESLRKELEKRQNKEVENSIAENAVLKSSVPDDSVTETNPLPKPRDTNQSYF